MKLYHDSRSLDCRAPFGAVRCGDIVRLRVYCQGRPRAVNAVITLNNQPYTIPLQPDGRDGYELRFAAPATPRLLWYYFAAVMENGQTEYLGNARDGLGGVGETYASAPPSFQLTVYARDYAPPAFLREGVMYQIFPDRFCRSRAPRYTREDIYLHENWDEAPLALFDPRNGDTHSRDFFGGDLQGIISKLDYLQSLHVTVLYLNPIFLARSNHRYDTGDYTRIDPMLGTQADLTRLCEEAAKRGMRVLLDGVFNHTGDDSLYFNRAGRYKTLGAYNSEKSPYYPWYTFFDYPDSYKSWWGFETLPEVNEESPEYLEFITGENGVVKKWLRLGAAGWRLDVADELPDAFLDALCASAKAEKADALVLGEVWEDATNKWAYGERRRYLLGGQLDSVMNYPFANAILNFARNGIAEGFAHAVTDIVENYPKPALDCMMNHIGTHDTERAITKIMGESAEGRDREWQSQRVLSDSEYQKGVTLLKLTAVLQFTLPGVPCIYYGDEAGLQGYKDPFNRGCYPWGGENQDLIAFYQTLGALRGSLDCLKTGELHFVSAVLGCVAYEREGDSDGILVIANRNEQEITYNLPDKWQYKREILHGKPVTACVNVPPMGCVILNF